MTDLPPLPDTQDPFALLGVDREDVDARRLRRAYVQLIKVYKPERAPDSFQRVHRAYEEASEQLRHGLHLVAPMTRAPAGGDSAADSDAGQGGTERPPAAAPDDDGVFEELRRHLERGADDDLDYVAGRLAEGDQHVGPEILEQLSSDRVRALVSRDALGWECLREQPPWVAARLFEERLVGMLLAGSVEAALAEATAPDVARAALDNAQLEPAVLQALCAAAWRDPDAAQKAHAAIFGDAVDHELGGTFTEIRGLAPGWQRVREATECPPAVQRFVELIAVVPWSDRFALARAFEDMPPEERGQAWQVFESAVETAPDVADFIHEQLLLYADAPGDAGKASALMVEVDARAVRDDRLGDSAGEYLDWRFLLPGLIVYAALQYSLLPAVWAAVVAIGIVLPGLIYKASGAVGRSLAPIRSDMRDIVDATGVDVETLHTIASRYKALELSATQLSIDQTMDMFGAFTRIRLAPQLSRLDDDDDDDDVP